MHQTPLTWGCGKQLSNGCEQAVMSIGDQQIHLGRSSCPHILRALLNQPALSSSAQTWPRQHFLLSFEVDSQCRQNDARIAFSPMPDLEMDQRPAYTTRQWPCNARSRHASNCWVKLWFKRLTVLALGVTPISV
jgi:hypothetical protein